jgi:deubiquitinase DESI2
MFVQRLLNRSIPGFVNRLAGLGSMVSCLMPQALTGNAPVNREGQDSGTSSGSRMTASAPFSGPGVKLGMLVLSQWVNPINLS